MGGGGGPRSHGSSPHFFGRGPEYPLSPTFEVKEQKYARDARETGNARTKNDKTFARSS
jgi:hypothetical protein